MKRDRREAAEEESLLTERQIMVLRLRSRGHSQQEIAEILGTSRSNVSILEKRANRNIARAKFTLHQWLTIKAPIYLKIAAGSDLFDLPEKIFSVADQKGIRLPVTSPDIIVQLKTKAPRTFSKRNITRDIDIYVTEAGELLTLEPMP